METNARRVTADDLPAILGWWVDRGCGAMPPDVLPPVGFVACDESGPAAAGFVYFLEGAPVALLEWFVSRPGMGAQKTRLHLRAVLEALQGSAESRGVRYCLGSVSVPAMAREAAAVGFLPVEGDFKHFIKFLRS